MEETEGLREPLLVPSAEKASVVERLTIDEMLRNHCGEFGRWQLRHFVLTSLAWALEAFHTMVMIFADRNPGYNCVADNGCYEGADTVCGFADGSWEWIGGQGFSTVSQWGLICDEKFKVWFVQSAFFSGCMIGAGVFGHLSDSGLGRRGSLRVVCILNSLFGCLTALSPNYYIYLLLRLFNGFSTGGVGLCAFVLATEPVGPSMRGAAGMSTFYFFSAGIALLSGIAYICQSWRILYVAISIPSVLFLFLVFPFIDESPRWYLVRGRMKEAMTIMHNIARSNGRTIPEGAILALDEEINSVENGSNDQEETKEASGTLVDVIRSPITRMRLLLAVAINFLCSVGYYGLSLNVVNLATNLYLNVLLNAIAEVPAFAITAVLLQRWGRKPLTIITMWFSGVFCFVGSLMATSGTWEVVRMLCGVMGIFGMAGTYNLLFIYTTELFPTVVRNAALGCATQAAQMGAILSPFIVIFGGPLPFVVFGVCGFLGGLCGFFLPETLNRPLYDTMTGIVEGETERMNT